MKNLQVFKNAEFGEVRTIEEDGKVLFCGSDIAKALGYANPRKALADHCKGVTKRNTPTTGGVQELSYIPEGDLYRLITHSKLPSAEKFESWMFDEVLPAIRKNGAYSLPQSEFSPQLQLLINMEMEQKRQAKELETVRADVQGMRDIISLNPNAWREDTRRLIVRIAQTLGGNEYIKDVTSEIYSTLNERFGVDLGIRLTNLRRRMADEGVSKTRRDRTTKVDVIAMDKKLIEGYLIIIKEMAVKYGVSEVA